MMFQVDHKRRIMDMLSGKDYGQVPIISAHSTATLDLMKWLGVFWPQANFESDYMTRLAIGGNTIMGFETIHVPFDHLVEAEALGARLSMGTEYEFPEVISTIDDPPVGLSFPIDLNYRGRTKVVLEAIKRIKAIIGPKTPIITSLMGPFTVSAQSFGLLRALKWSANNDPNIQRSMEMITPLLIDYAERQVNAGADIICVQEIFVSQNLLNPRFFELYITPHLNKIISNIKVPVILFIEGDQEFSLYNMIYERVAGLLVNAGSDPTIVKRLAHHEVALIGNISPQTLLNGNRKEILSSINSAYNNGIHMIAPSGSIDPHTKVKAIKTMAMEAKKLELLNYKR